MGKFTHSFINNQFCKRMNSTLIKAGLFRENLASNPNGTFPHQRIASMAGQVG